MGSVATVFGLDVRANVPLSFLQTARAKPTDRALDLSLGDADSLDWPAEANLISDQRQPDGSVGFQIERSAEAGYRIWSPVHGENVLSADGCGLRATTGSGGIEAWQRLLIAQVLPFAAVLRGLEVFHASAVVYEGGAVAFVGQSGSGKTSLALELCRGETDFIADDVLALERADDDLVGHPGTPVAGIDHAEAGRINRSESGEGEEILSVNSRERVARVPLAAEPAPLRTLFFLDRSPGGPAQPRFEPATDSKALLAATFNFVLADPERLHGLLDVCALVARQRVERIATGPETDVSELCGAVERRLRATP